MEGEDKVDRFYVLGFEPWVLMRDEGEDNL